MDVGQAVDSVKTTEPDGKADPKTCDGCGALWRDHWILCPSASCRHERRMDRLESDPWHYAKSFGVPCGWSDCYTKAKLKDFKGLPEISGGNLYIYGPNGTGKTHLMVALAYELTRELAGVKDLKEGWHHVARWVDAASIFQQLRESFREKSKLSERGVIEGFANYRVLFIDDLFAEKVSDYTLPAICQILRLREQNNRRTIITSNIPVDRVDNESKRVASLLGGFEHIEIGGDDRRKGRG